MVKKLLEHFMEKNCKRLIKKNLGLKRWLKEKEINYMLNGKVTIVYLIAGLMKKIWCGFIEILLYKKEYQSLLIWGNWVMF